jgi:hypothetical protein
LDLIREATKASWQNDLHQEIQFNLNQGADGSAKYEYNVNMGEDYFERTLFTHPRWNRRGEVVGTYGPFRLTDKETKVIMSGGLKEGTSGSDGASFFIKVFGWSNDENYSYQGNLEQLMFRAEQPGKIYQGSFDLKNFKNKNVKIQLIVKAGANSAQDWAVWTDARLVFNKDSNLNKKKLKFSSCNGIRARMIDTGSFKKPGKMDEHALLIINAQLYDHLERSINLYIQDLFDEGVRVWPFCIDHSQFLARSGRWKPQAGLQLRGFIRNVYAVVIVRQIHPIGIVRRNYFRN